MNNFFSRLVHHAQGTLPSLRPIERVATEPGGDHERALPPHEAHMDALDAEDRAREDAPQARFGAPQPAPPMPPAAGSAPSALATSAPLAAPSSTPLAAAWSAPVAATAPPTRPPEHAAPSRTIARAPRVATNASHPVVDAFPAREPVVQPKLAHVFARTERSPAPGQETAAQSDHPRAPDAVVVAGPRATQAVDVVGTPAQDAHARDASPHAMMMEAPRRVDGADPFVPLAALLEVPRATAEGAPRSFSSPPSRTRRTANPSPSAPLERFAHGAHEGTGSDAAPTSIEVHIGRIEVHGPAASAARASAPAKSKLPRPRVDLARYAEQRASGRRS